MLHVQIWESTTRVLLLVSDDDEQVNPELGDMLYRRYPDHLSLIHISEPTRR